MLHVAIVELQVDPGAPFDVHEIPPLVGQLSCPQSGSVRSQATSHAHELAQLICGHAFLALHVMSHVPAPHAITVVHALTVLHDTVQALATEQSMPLHALAALHWIVQS